VKIAIGIHRLLPRGGLEDHALRIAAELSRRGHEIVLHATGELPNAGVATVSLDRRPKPLTNHGAMTAFAADFIRATRGRFDRTVAFQPMPGIDVLFLADHLRDRPDVPFWKRLSPRFRAYARLEAGCFGTHSRTRVVGLARRQMQAFVLRYPESAARIAILPPTITEERRRPLLRTAELRRQLAARLALDEVSPIWLWLGLQPHIKGLDRAIEALALAPGATLLVGGVAPADRKLAAIRRRAGQLGVSDRIRWLGYLSGDDVPAHFAAADVLAHPARVDVTGAVILEALVNGLPVVATDVCGFAPHIELSRAGEVLASPFVVKDLAAALTRVCGPENAALSRNAIAYGQSTELYSGLSVACDLIEAAAWPAEITMAADPPASETAGIIQPGSHAWSP
jgi:UDP-glucose:(heptosyl)LPS alpha-1,3-glucosyltransferase